VKRGRQGPDLGPGGNKQHLLVRAGLRVLGGWPREALRALTAMLACTAVRIYAALLRL
jgi:hypothetical protein